MEQNTPFDQTVFEKDVLYYSHILFYSYSQDRMHNVLEGITKTGKKAGKEIIASDKESQVTAQEVIEEANKKIKDPIILKYLCPALNSITKDIRDISKIILGVLLPLSLASKIDLSVNPLLYAGMIIVVFNAGVSSLCKDIELKS